MHSFNPNNKSSCLEHIKLYRQDIIQTLSRVDEKDILNFIQLLIEARNQTRQIFIIGNGGSAANASHIANDLLTCTHNNKPHLKIISLTDNNAIITAIGNDFGYDMIFKKPLENLLQMERNGIMNF